MVNLFLFVFSPGINLVGHTSSYFLGGVFVVGGMNEEEKLNPNVMFFNIGAYNSSIVFSIWMKNDIYFLQDSKEWSIIKASGTPPKYNHAVTVIGNNLYMIGGSSEPEMFILESSKCKI